eukprot:1925279-Amphidinium_carterae.1
MCIGADTHRDPMQKLRDVLSCQYGAMPLHNFDWLSVRDALQKALVDARDQGLYGSHQYQRGTHPSGQATNPPKLAIPWRTPSRRE